MMVISVVVPVYNVEAYLDKCVQSLLCQDYDNYEIILIDDGSTDQSGKICDLYQEENDKISTFHKKNGGLSSARNFGVSQAKGNYVTFVDSDDYVEPTYLSDLYNLMKRNNADMSMTRVVLQNEKQISQNSNRLYKNAFEDYCVSSERAFWETYIIHKISWSACGKLFPIDVIKETPFPEGFYEEMASSFLYISKCKRVAIGDYVNNYHYVERKGSITHRQLDQRHYRIFDVCDEIKGFVHSNYPYYDKYTVLLYQNAVLQLLTKLSMEKKEYNRIFKKYVNYFRKSLIILLKERQLNIKMKYYACILCTNSFVFRVQRKIFECVHSIF